MWTNDFTYMWITRAAVCEYRKHIHLYRVCRPSAGIARYVAYSSCLHSPPVLLFSSIAFSIRSLLYYSVKTKSSHSFCPFFHNVSFSCLLAYVGDGRIFLTSNLNLRHLRWGGTNWVPNHNLR